MYAGIHKNWLTLHPYNSCSHTHRMHCLKYSPFIRNMCVYRWNSISRRKMPTILWRQPNLQCNNIKMWVFIWICIDQCNMRNMSFRQSIFTSIQGMYLSLELIRQFNHKSLSMYPNLSWFWGYLSRSMSIWIQI